MRKTTVLFYSIFVMSTTSCEEDEKDKAEGYEGRGSVACQEWQYALCEYAFDTCISQSGTREQCEDQYGSMECLSDESALACAEKFKAADNCTVSLEGCDFSDIANPQPAADACNEMNRLQCEQWINTCDSTMKIDECLDELEAKVYCDKAIGIDSSYEECLKAIENLDCDDEYPTVCKGVIITTSS